MSIETSDKEIREAFHSKKLSQQTRSKDVLVIDELGVEHGKTRIDIAVVNGYLHGYEIKSSKDTLHRLNDQIDSYKRSFQKISIISAEKHIQDIIETVPRYIGIIKVEKGIRGGITFTTERRPRLNPEIDLISMAHFLWKQEAIQILSSLGADKHQMKGTKIKLYENISKLLTAPELTEKIKEVFSAREDWPVALRRM